jgi:hypothetical protein
MGPLVAGDRRGGGPVAGHGKAAAAVVDDESPRRRTLGVVGLIIRIPEPGDGGREGPICGPHYFPLKKEIEIIEAVK